MATLTFLKIDRVIQVDSPQTEVTIQDLVNQIRDQEDELDYMDYDKICDAFGKQDLGGGVSVGITLVLLNNWRIQFEARTGPSYEAVTVSGGNLVAENDYNNNPIKASDFTQVTISQSSSPTIATPDSDVNLLHLIESLQGTHRSIGNVYYWDPTNGSDTNDGSQPSEAVATFAQAQSLATAGNHDVIFALAATGGGVTTVTETISITKDTLKLRGPGYQFQLVPSSSGTDTVTISADSAELSGFYIKTAATGSDNAVTVTGDNTLLKDLWIVDPRQHGINISSAARTKVKTCAIENAGQSGTGNAVTMGNTTTYSLVEKCILTGSADDGAELSGTGLTDNMFENNLIYNNGAYGIDIGSGVTRTGVRLHHTFSGNTSGSTNDAGSATFIETEAGGASASSIADAVWDELITDHQTTGTAGKTLKDIKTKATLASLK
jgi:hypothetical protein